MTTLRYCTVTPKGSKPGGKDYVGLRRGREVSEKTRAWGDTDVVRTCLDSWYLENGRVSGGNGRGGRKDKRP